MTYNLTVHYHNDPDDELGYEDDIVADNLEDAIKQVEQIEDYCQFYYYVLESEDGKEYYNTSQLKNFISE